MTRQLRNYYPRYNVFVAELCLNTNLLLTEREGRTGEY